jgi:hypothetical protein
MDKITSLVPTFTRRSSTVSSISTQSSLDPTNAVVKNRRTRALTLPLENPQKVGLRRIKQQTLVQDSSPLVALPFELREQIYRIVLGGKCIAIDLHDRRIGDQSDPWPAYERPGGERRGIRPWGFKPDRKANILSLLLTCRQMYTHGALAIEQHKTDFAIATLRPLICYTRRICSTFAIPSPIGASALSEHCHNDYPRSASLSWTKRWATQPLYSPI